MAKDVEERSTAELQREANAARSRDQWGIDEAFLYLTRIKGKQNDLAADELQEHAKARRLSVTCHHIVEGKIVRSGIVPAHFWRGQWLTFAAVKGHLEVLPSIAFDPGDHKYFITQDDLFRLYEPVGPTAGPTDKVGYQSKRAKKILRKKWPPFGVPPTGMTYKDVWIAVDAECKEENRNEGRQSPGIDTVTRVVKANREEAKATLR